MALKQLLTQCCQANEAEALETMSRLDKELSRLYVYASMLADEDTRVSEPQGMQQEMEQLKRNASAELEAQSKVIDESRAEAKAAKEEKEQILRDLEAAEKIVKQKINDRKKESSLHPKRCAKFSLKHLML
jgi:oligoendopeptidase F